MSNDTERVKGGTGVENHPLILFSASNGGVHKHAQENGWDKHAIVQE
jgi:hypothetical protein